MTVSSVLRPIAMSAVAAALGEGGGVPSLAPVVSNQTAPFGRLAVAGAGGWRPWNTGGSITSATIDSGTDADHWQIASDGTISPSATGVSEGLSASYTLSCTFTNAEGSDTATITINTVENRWTVASDAEADALTWTDAAMGGKGVLFRGPQRGGPTYYSYVDPGGTDDSKTWIRNRNYSSEVVLSSSDASDPAVWLLSTWVSTTPYTSMFRASGNLTFENLIFSALWNPALNYITNRPACAIQGPTSASIKFKSCEIKGNVRDYTKAQATAGTADGKTFMLGIFGTSGSSQIGGGELLFENCTVHGASRLLNLPPTSGDGAIVLVGNTFYDFVTDCCVFSQSARVTACWNFLHSPYADTSDTAHGDFFQWAGATATSPINIRMFGNIACVYRLDGDGNSKKDYQGGAHGFMDDITGTNYYDGVIAHNNLVLSEIASGGGYLRPGKDSYVWRCTAARDPAASVNATYPWLAEATQDGGIGGTTPVNNTFKDNIASSVNLIGGSGSTKAGNVETNSTSLDTYLTGPIGSSYTSKADIIAKLTPTAGYLTKGGVSGGIDFTAHTVDITGAPWSPASILSADDLNAGDPQGTDIGTLTASGGSAPYTFSLVDTASNKVQLNADGVTLEAGSATSSVDFNCTVRTTDRFGRYFDTVHAITVASAYTQTRVTFDGANDYITYTPNASMADSSGLTISFWMDIGGSDVSTHNIITHAARVTVTRNSSGKIAWSVSNTSGSSIWAGTTDGTHYSAEGLIHVALAFDAVAGTAQVYINGSSVARTDTTAPTAGTIHWNRGVAAALFATSAGATKYTGQIGDLWMNNAYLDLSANISKFISGGVPVDLGSTGQLPTGSSPLIFLGGPMVAADWNAVPIDNLGTATPTFTMNGAVA